jgi:hypothetical protein
MPGRFRDPTRTPAERVRAGYEAIRRGAGDDVFILGCGAPVGALVGVLDGMRIGADVAPWWSAPADAEEQQPAYELTTPATQHAFVNTCNRSFMHRNLWMNDPDCVMLRTSDTRLSAPAAAAWARTVGCSGGLALVSDDLALLGAEAHALLDEIVATGRAADAAATRAALPEAVDRVGAVARFDLVALAQDVDLGGVGRAVGQAHAARQCRELARLRIALHLHLVRFADAVARVGEAVGEVAVEVLRLLRTDEERRVAIQSLRLRPVFRLRDVRRNLCDFGRALLCVPHLRELDAVQSFDRRIKCAHGLLLRSGRRSRCTARALNE